MDEKDLAQLMKNNPELEIDTRVTAVHDEPKPSYDVNERAGRLFAQFNQPEIFVSRDEVAGKITVKGSDVTAVGDITKAGLDFKSKTEREAWYEWLPAIEHVRAEYEPMNLKVAGANYTPDIVLLRPNGRVWFIEVKGAGGWKAYQSGRSSKRSLKQCSRYYAWLGDFYLLMKIPKKDGGGGGTLSNTDKQKRDRLVSFLFYQYHLGEEAAVPVTNSLSNVSSVCQSPPAPIPPSCEHPTFRRGCPGYLSPIHTMG